jgi:sulfate permease, SulP family
MAGITVGLIALPLALALGIASIPPGTQTSYPPPAVGLFTAIFAGLVISSLGGSRVQIGGPTAAFIPIVLLIIEKYGYSGLILATLMAGGILVVMGLARMGTLIKFIPWPVTSGFTTGIAVSIMATQVADFLGIRAETPAPREFLPKLQWIWENLSHCHPPSMGLFRLRPANRPLAKARHEAHSGFHRGDAGDGRGRGGFWLGAETGP